MTRSSWQVSRARLQLSHLQAGVAVFAVLPHAPNRPANAARARRGPLHHRDGAAAAHPRVVSSLSISSISAALDVVGRVGEHQVDGPVGARRQHRRDGAAPQRRSRDTERLMFCPITAAARWSDSTNTAVAAPRDSASSPSAPEPAYRSSTDAPSRSIRAASTLNSDSRTRSVVGRVPRGGTAMRRPPRPPATMRVSSPPPVGHHPRPARSPIRRSG